MVDKGLAKKSSSHGLAVFSPGIAKLDLIGHMVREFTKRVLEVDGPLPVSAFTGSALLDDGELEELEKLLEQNPEVPSEGRE
jgi:predicted transcriptional regulator